MQLLWSAKTTVPRMPRHACFRIGDTLCQQGKPYKHEGKIYISPWVTRKSVFVILSRETAVKMSTSSYRSEAGCVRLKRSGLKSSTKRTRSGCSSAWCASCVDLEPRNSAASSRFSSKSGGIGNADNHDMPVANFTEQRASAMWFLGLSTLLCRSTPHNPTRF